jgi:hypothetical protein
VRDFLAQLSTNATAASQFVLALQAAGMNCSAISVSVNSPSSEEKEDATSSRNAKLGALAVLVLVPTCAITATVALKRRRRRAQQEEIVQQDEPKRDNTADASVAAAAVEGDAPPEVSRGELVGQEACA